MSVDTPRVDGVDRAVGGELEAGQAAEGGDVLVLLADRLAEHVDLDVARLLGELGGRARARAGGRAGPAAGRR